MTKTDVIDYIDSIKPNVYTSEQKSGWIDLLEEKLRTEILSHFEDVEPETEPEIRATLLDNENYTYLTDEKCQLDSVSATIKGICRIPETYDTLIVSTIGADAFKYCTKMTGVIIPETVTNIDDSAFGTLTEFTIYGVQGSQAEIFAEYKEIFFCELKNLIASGPYEDMYYRWVEAQIDYANNETARYNNAMALFNDAYSKFRNYYNRTHKHKTASLSVL